MTETGRNLDFFVIAAPGTKERLIEQVDWLEEAHALSYRFKKTERGKPTIGHLMLTPGLSV